MTLPVPNPANHAKDVGNEESARQHQWLPDRPAFTTHHLGNTCGNLITFHGAAKSGFAPLSSFAVDQSGAGTSSVSANEAQIPSRCCS